MKDLEIILVSDSIQAQKGKYNLLSLISRLQLLIFMYVYKCGYKNRDES